MDSRIPPAPYPFERMGAKFPPHEIGAHTPVVKREMLAEVVDDGGLAASSSASVYMRVPDSRLMASLSIVFVPTVRESLGDFSTRSTIWLAATEDVGDGPQPVEDLLGTEAAPVRLVQAGLRGLIYSPTAEVVGMQATLVLGAPQSGETNLGLGKWYAQARWQELSPMSEIDWRKAVAEMVLIPKLGVARVSEYAPG